MVGRGCRLNLARRLALGAVVLALLAVAAAGIAGYGLSQTQRLAAEAMAAQRRMEAYGSFSGRVSEWSFGLLSGAQTGDGEGVRAALDQLDRLTAEDIAAARTVEEADRRSRNVVPARLRAEFGQLQRTLAAAAPGSPRVETAMALYAVQVPAMLGQQITLEAQRRDAALALMERLRHRLHLAAIGIAVAAPLVLLGLYLMLLRPLFARLASASAAAEGLAMGRLAPGAGGHDELGLLFVRLRQMAARLDRRRAALEHDRARLGALVEERTAELSRANSRLSAIDTQRRRFFADVSHELRTPLTVILGEAELGAKQVDPAVQASFATIRARALRLFHRIEDLLRIARSESGQLELLRERVDLSRIVSAAENDLAPLTQRGRLCIDVDLPHLIVGGDPEWLRQVVAGIIGNAVKYAGSGARLRITGRQEASRAIVDFADNGPGLSPEIATQVFDRFARGGGAAGFGVGLALAAWVVEAHGGGLSAHRAEEGGLLLRMTLPLWEEDGHDADPDCRG